MAATVSSSQAPTTKVYFNLQTSSEESIWNCINIISQNNRSATNSIQSVIKKIDQRTFNLTSLDVDPRIRKLLDRLCRHAHHLKKLDESFLKSLQETPPIIWNTKCVKPYFTISQEIHQVTVPLIVLFLQDLKAKKPLSKTHEVAIAPSDTESFSSLLEKCCCNLQQAKETHRRFLHTLEKLPAFNETAFKQTTVQFKFPQDTLPTISKSKLTDLISRLEKNEHLTWKTGLTEIAYLAKWMIQSDPSLSSNTSEALIFSQAAIQHPTALLNILKKCLYTIDTYYPSLSTSSSPSSSQPSVFPDTPCKLKIGTRSFSVPTTQSFHLNDTKLNLLKSVYEKLSRADQTADVHTQTTPEERQRIYDMIDWLHGYEDPEIVTDTARDDYKQYYQYNIPKLLKALKITLMTHGQMS
ncbi:MAG: hypothetical protein K2P51_01805 [Rhabdochlamydiaceae bacterium]|nr:hypothetical protein [Rhabdochlamydiaceae bacterium]